MVEKSCVTCDWQDDDSICASPKRCHNKNLWIEKGTLGWMDEDELVQSVMDDLNKGAETTPDTDNEM